MMSIINNKGQSLIEILLAMSLTVVLLPALVTGLVASREGKAQQAQRLQAVALLREAEEAVRSVREKDWNSFAINGTFYPEVSGFSWILAPGSQTIDGFTRTIVISDVRRDANGAIVASGGIIDPSTKKVVSTVSWQTPLPSQVESTNYLHRYLGNTEYLQTTEPEFNGGIKDNIVVTNVNGGEFMLKDPLGDNWCEPKVVAELDLPKSGDAQAVSAIPYEAFAGTGRDASGESLVDIDISDTDPPVPTIVETFDGYKTNDVFGEEEYAYIATDNNSKEAIIIDISTKPFREVGFFNAPGPQDGQSIFVEEDTGYLVQQGPQENTLWNFDLESKAGSRPAIDPDGIGLAGLGESVFVVGDYAYVATGSTNSQLQIIDISNPASMTVVGWASLNAQGGRDVFVNEKATRAYLVTAASGAQAEFFIIDITNKNGNRPVIGSYDTQGMDPQGVEVVPGNRAIVVGRDGEEYQVVHLGNEKSPFRCGGMQLDVGVDSASAREPDEDNFVYIVTGDRNAEFKVIPGGKGGFPPLGTFESTTFDAGKVVAFNYLTWTADVPQDTSLSFKLAINNDGITWDYFGPDGTSASYFTSPQAIPLSRINGRYLRYKAFLKSLTGDATPIVYDVSINYSP